MNPLDNFLDEINTLNLKHKDLLNHYDKLNNHFTILYHFVA